MKRQRYPATGRSLTGGLALLVWTAVALGPLPAALAAELSEELKSVPYGIVYETWHDNNWELFIATADGSKQENLTRTPKIHELYPHVSPDGTKVCFLCDEGEGASKIRNVYYMNMDGSGRTLVAQNGRDPCWKADSKAIAYLKGELKEFTYTDYASKGIAIYDLATQGVPSRQREHPNKELFHLYNLCWSPDGNWFLATVHAGMGYQHAILAIEAEGTKVFDLKIPGCRPDISPDGKRVAWGPSDWALRVGDLDFTGPQPKVLNARDVVTSPEPMKVYHIDWSPDGKYVTYSRGPEKKRLGLIPEMVGVQAEGWDIYVADPAATNRVLQITTDGACNKEPDWAPAEVSKR